MVKILRSLGCEVNYNPQQTCCGQPTYNAGFFDLARQLAQKFLIDFPHENRYIVCPSASCVGMIRNHYAHILHTKEELTKYYPIQRNLFEFSEFLVDVLGVEKIENARLEGIATYHDSCSALRECGIKYAPRKLLANIEGLTLIEMHESEVCCGFGGTFAVKFQAISVAMAEQKIDNASVTQADYLISTDYSCLMHLAGYIEKNRKKIQVMHLIDALAQSW